MKRNTLKRISIIGLVLLPAFATTLSAKPSSQTDKHGGRGPSIGAFIGIQAPAGSVEIRVGKVSFRYNSGVFYKHTKHGYVVTKAPRGAIVRSLPPKHQKVVVGGYVYYCQNDVYYRKTPNGYIVVEAPVVLASTPGEVSTPTTPSATTPVVTELSVWQGEQELLVRDGAFFRNTPEGLVWVEQPIGALSRALPESATPIWYKEIEYFDIDGILFRKTPDGYKVVEAPWKEAL